jgi:hypothetical protein
MEYIAIVGGFSVLWLVHVGQAAVVSAPIVYFGTQARSLAAMGVGGFCSSLWGVAGVDAFGAFDG